MHHMLILPLIIVLHAPFSINSSALILATVSGESSALVASRQEPQSADLQIAQLYESLASLPLTVQKQQAWALSSDVKAALWTININKYLSAHPELTSEAQEVLRDGIRLVSSPGWFDVQPGSVLYPWKDAIREEHKRRAESVLSPETIIEVFIRLGREPLSDATLMHQVRPVAGPCDALNRSNFESASERDARATRAMRQANKKTDDGLKLGPHGSTLDCTCNSWLECWMHGRTCDPFECTIVQHCGWYGDEACWGLCFG
jgi:hypothetical protein